MNLYSIITLINEALTDDIQLDNNNYFIYAFHSWQQIHT